MSNAMVTQSNELELSRGKLRSLEDQLAQKESVIEEQKRLLESVRDQSVDGKREFESLYKDVIMINMQLEAKVLELQDKLARSGGVGAGKNHSYSMTAGRPSRSSSILTRGDRTSVGGGNSLLDQRPGSNNSSRSSAVSPTSPGFGETLSGSVNARGVPVGGVVGHSANMDIAGRGGGLCMLGSATAVSGMLGGPAACLFRVGSPPSSGGSTDQT